MKAAADEREVRVSVCGLDLDLIGRQLAPKLQLIVQISGAFRKNGADDVEVRPDRVGPRHQTSREILREKAGGRVARRVKAPRVSIEGVTGNFGGAGPNVDDVQSGARRQLEGQFKRRHSAVNGREERITN